MTLGTKVYFVLSLFQDFQLMQEIADCEREMSDEAVAAVSSLEGKLRGKVTQRIDRLRRNDIICMAVVVLIKCGQHKGA